MYKSTYIKEYVPLNFFNFNQFKKQTKKPIDFLKNKPIIQTKSQN